MRNGEAMFRVLVLGGLALTSQEACGSTGSPADAGSDTAQNADSFPSELPAFMDANVGGDATDGATTGEDGSTGDATSSQDGFPQEGPPPPPPP
jgi:hypothetical protein